MPPPCLIWYTNRPLDINRGIRNVSILGPCDANVTSMQTDQLAGYGEIVEFHLSLSASWRTMNRPLSRCVVITQYLTTDVNDRLHHASSGDNRRRHVYRLTSLQISGAMSNHYFQTNGLTSQTIQMHVTSEYTKIHICNRKSYNILSIHDILWSLVGPTKVL